MVPAANADVPVLCETPPAGGLEALCDVWQRLGDKRVQAPLSMIWQMAVMMRILNCYNAVVCADCPHVTATFFNACQSFGANGSD